MVDQEVVALVDLALPTLAWVLEARGTTVVVIQVIFNQVEAIRAGKQQLPLIH